MLALVVVRIVVCGTQSRALTIAKHFDAEPKPVSITSSRGFTTITGCFQGVPVSAVSIGMVSCYLLFVACIVPVIPTTVSYQSSPLWLCAVVPYSKQFAGCRLICCGAAVGSFHDGFFCARSAYSGGWAHGYHPLRDLRGPVSGQCQRWYHCRGEQGVYSCHTQLQLFCFFWWCQSYRRDFLYIPWESTCGQRDECKSAARVDRVVWGGACPSGTQCHRGLLLLITKWVACGWLLYHFIFCVYYCIILYSLFSSLLCYCLDRIDPNFEDDNHTVVDDVIAKEPDALTMEMETYLLFHLAACSKIPIHVTAASIVVANRKSSNVIDEPTLLFLEANGGVAALKTLVLQDLKA